jgi:anti-sigma regulatory factor (Ser/Thr protein kinase)
MHPDRSVLTNGTSPSTRQRVARTELDELRATCRRQELLIDSLGEAAATLRRGALALKAENVQLRAESDRARPRRGSRTRAAERDAVEAQLALDARAPAAARSVVADCLGRHVAASEVDDAKLLVTELVTNSVRHSGAAAGDHVVVRVELTPGLLRLEVEDSGRGGLIAPRAAGTESTGGFGLNLVQALSERWGVERVAIGGTRVWAQLARA